MLISNDSQAISVKLLPLITPKMTDRTMPITSMATTPIHHCWRLIRPSVVVSGSLPGKPLPDGTPGPNLYCAVIVKTVDAQTRSKTGINDLLRD